MKYFDLLSTRPFPGFSLTPERLPRFSFLLLTTFVITLFLCGVSRGATYTVTKTADTNDGACNSDCSLREAIAAANVAPDADIINFDPHVFSTPKTITVLSTLLIADSTNLQIAGNGSNMLTISGGDAVQILIVDPNAVATISGVTISNGKMTDFGRGAGIRNQLGTLNLSNSVINGNVVGPMANGGAIYNLGGILNIDNCSFSNNSAGSAGAISSETPVEEIIDTVTITNSSFTENTATNIGGAIGGGKALNITDSTFTNNKAKWGGAIGLGSAATLLRVTFTNNSALIEAGGAIVGGGDLSITDAQFTGNHAKTNGGAIMLTESARPKNIQNTTFSMNTADQDGGAIFNFRSRVTFTKIALTSNSAGRYGGGYSSDNAFDSSTLVNSVVSNNTAAKEGGGIYHTSGTLNLNETLVTGNTASAGGIANGGGGGIRNGVSTLNVTNSTITGNTTPLFGGGIMNGGTTNLINSTLNANQAQTGGGVYNLNTWTVNSRNSILGDNTGTSNPDFRGTLTSQGYNLIENFQGMTIAGIATGNILGLDPQLVTLRANGGPTNTVALQSTSPAIDAADPANFPVTDQRGVARPQDGDLNGSSRADIGAYERQPNVLVVSKIADTNDTSCNADCSLREAITTAGINVFPDNVVLFDPSVFGSPQTITLTMGEIVLANHGTLAVNGPGAGLLTISGNGQSRIFVTNGGAFSALGGMSLTGGNGAGSSDTGTGGAIRNFGNSTTLTNVTIRNNSAAIGGGINSTNSNLTLNNCLIANNTSETDGAGIFASNNPYGSVILNKTVVTGNSAGGAGGGIMASGVFYGIDSSISNNSASERGGGLYNRGFPATLSRSTISNNHSGSFGAGIMNTGELLVVNSTVSGNSSQSNGGGIYNDNALDVIGSTITENNSSIHGGGIFNNDSFVTISGSTISSNSASGVGGGVFNSSFGHVTAGNSIFADNSAVLLAPDFERTLTSLGYNLVENTTHTTIEGTTTGNITGQDPKLGPLALNGGPTRTKALLPSSPAIDTGDPVTFQTVDQREVSRPKDGDRNGASLPDIGAFERDPRIDGTPFDFDGDGKADVSVFRPSVGDWYLDNSSSGFTGVHFGQAEDMPAPGDFDGDGKTDISVFRPSVGDWFRLNSSDNSFTGLHFGATGDLPAVGDFDGDGKADISVYRPSVGDWFRLDSSNGQFVGLHFGATEDKPAVGDFDGDGKADISVYRPSVGDWYRLNSSDGQFVGIHFGISEDKPTPADYDGDGKTDISVFRQSSGDWFRLNSGSGNSFTGLRFGSPGDQPVAADYDGDGKADVAVFRPSEGNWYMLNSTAGYSGQHFGVTEDKPTPGSFVY